MKIKHEEFEMFCKEKYFQHKFLEWNVSYHC